MDLRIGEVCLRLVSYSASTPLGLCPLCLVLHAAPREWRRQGPKYSHQYIRSTYYCDRCTLFMLKRTRSIPMSNVVQKTPAD
jgi:hypothetical protein